MSGRQLTRVAGVLMPGLAAPAVALTGHLDKVTVLTAVVLASWLVDRMDRRHLKAQQDRELRTLVASAPLLRSADDLALILQVAIPTAIQRTPGRSAATEQTSQNATRRPEVEQ